MAKRSVSSGEEIGVIHFACPYCRKRLKISTDKTGRRFPCPRCRSVIMAPRSLGELTPLNPLPPAPLEEIEAEFVEASGDSAEVFLPDLAPEWESEAKTSNRAMMLVAVGLTGSVAAAVLLVVLVASSSAPEKAPPSAVAASTGGRIQFRPETVRPVVPEPEQKHIPSVPVLPALPEPKVMELKMPPLEKSAPQPSTVPEKPPVSEKPVPVPGQLLAEVYPGYQTRRVRGFLVYISTQAVREAEKERGRPWAALDDEFAGVVKMLPKKALAILQGVRTFVEWDARDPSNDQAIARYNALGSARSC